MIDLKKAREIAARVRLPEDEVGISLSSQSLQNREQHRDSMLRHGLLISKDMTPLIEERLNVVCDRLFVPRKAVTAFIYNSAEIQADCVTDSLDTCVLRFTSGLINLMDEAQFQFVVGHEIGHFLLGHGACSQYISEDSSEEYIVRRARELSCDRIGFFGANSIDESVQAIIKTASGLGDEFLRYDVARFITQLSELSNPSKGESRNSTHPSVLIRCRSLLWFSMAVSNLQELGVCSDDTIAKIDKKVCRDLEKFVDGEIRARKQEHETDIILWKACILIISTGSFSKELQDRFSKRLGAENLRKLTSFFDSFEKEEIEPEAKSRLDTCISSIYREFPMSAKDIELSAINTAYELVMS